MLAQDAEFYELPCHSTSIPGLASYSDSCDSFDFVSPFARDEYSDSDWEEEMEEGTIDDDDALPEPSGSSNPFRGLGMADLPSLVHISKEIRLISSSVVEVTFRNTRPNSFPGEDSDDEEEAILSPDPSFPHPHLLSTIIEEDEEEEASSPERDSEDEDELSDTETIRPSRFLARP
jgi:hypothetical protein